MKHFIFKCTLFILPIAALFAPPLFVFMVSGEHLSLSTVAELQEKNKNILYMSSDSARTTKPYKFFSTILHNPEVVVIGTSRTGTFKSSFFKDSSVFYNAGSTADYALNTDDLYQYIDGLPSTSKLQVLLFDVSSYVAASNKVSGESATSYSPASYFLTTGWRRFYLDYIQKRFTVSELLAAKKDNSHIGFTALLHSSGYRFDGSLERGDIDMSAIQKDLPRQIQATIADMPNSLEYKGASAENLASIDRLLRLCASKNIYVIGYSSPYAQEIYDHMMSLQDEHGAKYRDLPVVLSALFGQHSFHFYDTRDLSALGSSDNELYDVAHPTEKSTIRLIISLAQKEPRLNAYVDVSTLKKDIQTELY